MYPNVLSFFDFSSLLIFGVHQTLFLTTITYAFDGLNHIERSNTDETTFTSFGHDKLVVCYWGTWANYRPKLGKFTPANVDSRLCTHLIYSFVGLDSETNTIKSLDPWMDLEDNYGLGGFAKALDLKRFNPDLKVSLAIGGWNEGSKKYSDMASNETTRQTFIQSVVDFIQHYGFDGLDLDWEYPANRGGRPSDKENFVHLISELRTAFDLQEAKGRTSSGRLILTTAIGASPSIIDSAYDVKGMYKYLDYVHIMAYDYHGKWDGWTGMNAPLKTLSEQSMHNHSVVRMEPGMNSISIEETLTHLMKKGGVPEKTVLGIPLYGRTYTLKNPHDARLGARTQSTSFKGPYTREDGFLGYNEICEELMRDEEIISRRSSSNDDSSSDASSQINGLQENTWKIERMVDQGVPYMHKSNKWVSFDDELSVSEKAVFAYDLHLAGVMVWSIDTDDFNAHCSEKAYPLLRSINSALHKRSTTGGGFNSEAQSDAELRILRRTPTMILFLVSLTVAIFLK